ncbi:uncharacterized protein [Venturia canescens]|uniref:uncharacterized protein isoform X2 n=1 Tax=Venturia canescens TaxID=32260 RepID=UPI001C9C745D|nr:uncharacterized protein LOC122409361 isoform X2 [Venturia canescens]
MGPWAFGVSIVLISAIGLLINGYVLLVVFGFRKQAHQQQTANTLLLIHLGAVEAAVCLILLIFTTGGWPLSGSWCIVYGFLLAVLHPVALWTVTGLNCDRYCAIAAPLHYAALVSPRRVSFGLAASWLGALLLCIPPFSGIVPPYKYSPGLGCCVPDFGNDRWGNAATVYGAVYAFLGLALPAILVTVCNLRVLGIARYHRHRIASAIYEVTLSAQVTITHQRNPFFVPTVTSPAAGGPPPRFHSAASTVMQLVGSLYLLYVPYCAFVLWEAVGAALSHQQHRLHAHPRLASLASLLLASSPPINGLLYGLKSPTLRRSIRNYWRKKVTKSELQQEIQARTPSVAGSRRPSGSGPATASLFPFPPLQRRLSEALINLANTRNPNAATFESGNIGSFHRSRLLQPAASCNTLRVPSTGTALESSADIRGSKVRASASAASLMGSHYRNSDLDEANDRLRSNLDGISSSNESPRILITRANSTGETRQSESPFVIPRSRNPQEIGSSRCQKRRWRHISTESDSSTGSSDASSVWTTGVTPKIARIANLKNCIENWPSGKCFERVKTLEEAGTSVTGVRETSNNSESSEGTDTTTTLTLSSKMANLTANERLRETMEKGHSREARDQRSESEPESWSSSEDEAEANSTIFEINGSPTVARGCRKKSRNNRPRDEQNKKRGVPVESREGARQMRPLLTLS